MYRVYGGGYWRVGVRTELVTQYWSDANIDQTFGNVSRVRAEEGVRYNQHKKLVL